MRILADRAGVDLAPTKGESQGPGRADLAKINDWAMRFFRANLQADDVGRAAREYLRSRKFSNSMVDRFGLGLASPSSGRNAADQQERCQRRSNQRSARPNHSPTVSAP